MDIPTEITCVECGGVASLIGYLPPDDEELEPGTSMPYRCADCLDRFDVVVVDEISSDDRGDTPLDAG
jgi:hypothetical protein